jgi:hypothetical protein
MHDPERLALDVLRARAGKSARRELRTGRWLRRLGGHHPRRGHRRAVPVHREVDRQHQRTVDRPHQRRARSGHALHGRHEGLAHRPRERRAARRDAGQRDLLRGIRRTHRADLPAEGPRHGRHHRHRRRPSKPTVCTDDEIDYFFDLIAQVFPHIAVDREQIVYTFSGIRPLPATTTSPGLRVARLPHRGGLDGVPVLSLVGGKWTTFRALAEHLSTEVLALWPPAHGLDARSRDRRRRRLPAHRRRPRRWLGAHRGAHAAAFADRMLERYGTYADELLSSPSRAPLEHAPATSGGDRLAEREEVVTLIDCCCAAPRSPSSAA